MQKVKNVQKGTYMMTNVGQSIAKKFRFVQKKQYKCIQIYAKNPIMQRASLGLVTSKCINPPSTFCFAGKTEVYTQGITLHWVTRSDIILDLMFKLELKC